MDIKLIVGLGNPGLDYEKTRHNAGFWFLDDFFKSDFKFDKSFNAEVAETTIAQQRIWLLKPKTFMNRSGDAVQKICHFYKIDIAQIMVVHDELDLPTGIAKLKVGGGHGGHNGLRDIIDKLGTKEFLRLRIGIDHPGDRNEVSNYVLKSPSKEDKYKIDTAMTNAARAVDILIQDNLDKAMLALHTN